MNSATAFSVQPLEVLDFCDEMMYESPCSRIIEYLAWSDNPGFKDQICLKAMLDRKNHEDVGQLNFKSHESKIFIKRFNVIASENYFYDLITEVDPSVEQIERAATIDFSYSILYPIKRFLIDHPKLAKVYRGFLPFGNGVKKFYNTIVADDMKIKHFPSFKDYVNLKRITNNKSDLSGIPTVTINTWMYKKGKELVDKDQDTQVED
jgi:hypothetical protein